MNVQNFYLLLGNVLFYHFLFVPVRISGSLIVRKKCKSHESWLFLKIYFLNIFKYIFYCQALRIFLSDLKKKHCLPFSCSHPKEHWREGWLKSATLTYRLLYTLKCSYCNKAGGLGLTVFFIFDNYKSMFFCILIIVKSINWVFLTMLLSKNDFCENVGRFCLFTWGQGVVFVIQKCPKSRYTVPLKVVYSIPL